MPEVAIEARTATGSTAAAETPRRALRKALRWEWSFGNFAASVTQGVAWGLEIRKLRGERYAKRRVGDGVSETPRRALRKASRWGWSFGNSAASVTQSATSSWVARGASSRRRACDRTNWSTEVVEAPSLAGRRCRSLLASRLRPSPARSSLAPSISSSLAEARVAPAGLRGQLVQGVAVWVLPLVLRRLAVGVGGWQPVVVSSW